MNKKLIYLFAVLVAGIFLISACQQDAVGGRIPVNRNINDNEDIRIRPIDPTPLDASILYLRIGETVSGLTLNRVIEWDSCDVTYKGDRVTIDNGRIASGYDGRDTYYIGVLAIGLIGDPGRTGCNLLLSTTKY